MTKTKANKTMKTKVKVHTKLKIFNIHVNKANINTNNQVK